MRFIPVIPGICTLMKHNDKLNEYILETLFSGYKQP